MRKTEIDDKFAACDTDCTAYEFTPEQPWKLFRNNVPDSLQIEQGETFSLKSGQTVRQQSTEDNLRMGGTLLHVQMRLQLLGNINIYMKSYISSLYLSVLHHDSLLSLV